MSLPTLTLHQPYASLIAEGVKTIETRSWKAPDALIGEVIGIHAAARKMMMGDFHTIWPDGVPVNMFDRCFNAPLGAIVATARLAACVPIGHLPAEFVFGTEKYPIPSCPGYEVDFHGDVWSTVPWRGTAERVLATQFDRDGYVKVRPSRDEREVNLTVHRLVAEAWIGPRPDGKQVRHVDGDPSNNAPWNLRYGTPSENAIDKVRHGRGPLGHSHHKAKLSPGDLIDIFAGRDLGEPVRSIAKRHGVSHKAIQRVLTGQSYGPPPAAVDDSGAQGRWAWMLGDIKPTTERCPACWGVGLSGFSLPPGAPMSVLRCRTCEGVGTCAPVPAKGRQKVWRWTP